MSDGMWIDKEVRDLEITVPRWIDQDITCSDVAAILQGGCASGAYMPAVTYHEALQTMVKYEEEILDSLDGTWLEFDTGKQSFSGLACDLVSMAVESWCMSIEEELMTAIEEMERDNA